MNLNLVAYKGHFDTKAIRISKYSTPNAECTTFNFQYTKFTLMCKIQG